MPLASAMASSSVSNGVTDEDRAEHFVLGDLAGVGHVGKHCHRQEVARRMIAAEPLAAGDNPPALADTPRSIMPRMRLSRGFAKSPDRVWSPGRIGSPADDMAGRAGERRRYWS